MKVGPWTISLVDVGMYTFVAFGFLNIQTWVQVLVAILLAGILLKSKWTNFFGLVNKSDKSWWPLGPMLLICSIVYFSLYYFIQVKKLLFLANHQMNFIGLFLFMGILLMTLIAGYVFSILNYRRASQG